MGYNHQLYLIVKIKSRYRTLAVVQHQNLYGQDVIEACLHVLRTLSAETNRIPILQELHAANLKDDEFWSRKDECTAFPFLATCLLVASSFDPIWGGSSPAHLYSISTTYNRVHNDSGITVIDISNLKSLSWCIFFPRRMKPLSATAYLKRYGEATNRKLSLVQEFEAYVRINAEQLRTWGEGSVVPLPQEDFDRDGAERRTLRDQAMGQLIDMLLKSPDVDTYMVDEARHLSDFMPRFRSRLLSLAQNRELPRSSAVVSYIELAFSGDAMVDLSPFVDLPADDLVEIASNLLHSKSIQRLDLSHLKQLSESDLTNLFSNKPEPETLYLLEMPQISLRYVASLWGRPSSKIKDVYHTELFHSPFPAGDRPCPWNLKPSLSERQATLQPLQNAATRNPIKNIFWVRIFLGEGKSGQGAYKDNGHDIDWERAEPPWPSSIPKENFSSENRMFSAVFPVHDLFLTPTKLVTGLANFSACALSEPWFVWTRANAGNTLAYAFATASSRLAGEQTRTTIGPLPGLIYPLAFIAESELRIRKAWPLDFPEMGDGDRSIVIISERRAETLSERWVKEDKLRLAVITRSASVDGSYRYYEAEPMERFLKDTLKGSACSETEDLTQLLEYWTNNMASVGSIDAKEANELLPVMQRSIKLGTKDEKRF
ncbi:MAG: hypothetical protein Q9170_004655 [Blastenia crenularia]